jgi:hypothetical protein
LQYYCNKSAHNSIAIYFFLALLKSHSSFYVSIIISDLILGVPNVGSVGF